LWVDTHARISTRILRPSFCADIHKNNIKIEGE
jgi:hypothetical protein